MKGIRVFYRGTEWIGVQDDVGLRLVPTPGSDIIGMIEQQGWEGLDREATSVVALADARLLAPIARPSKILCVAVNYRDHIEETGAATPDHPIIFAKVPSALTGDGDFITAHEIAQGLDYEAELGVVIGRRTSRVSAHDALDYVAGYTAANDVSARNLQVADGQFTRAKSLDTFAPLGPALVSPDEVGDAGTLDITSSVNGELRQKSNTSQLVFGVATLIAFCSEAMTLEPGDLILTGTPGGVGGFSKPPRYLKAGDVVTVTIERIGTLTNPVVGPEASKSE